MRKLKVAVIAPVFGEIGGPEISTIDLVSALVDKGIDVTLFAPADWTISKQVKHVHTLEQSLWNMTDFKDHTRSERTNLIFSALFTFFSYQDQFDIVHLSAQKYAYAFCKNIQIPSIITLHNSINKRDLRLLRKTPTFIVSQTKKYQKEIQTDSYAHLGIPTENIQPVFKKGSGLVFIGRIAEQKGAHIAIDIAKKSNKSLLLVGRIGNSTERQQYYKKQIFPHIDGVVIRHEEEVSHNNIYTILSQSEALLFPIIRPETFGRVSIESLACGTPVLGSTIDPLPEILGDKTIATLSENRSTLIAAAKNTSQFNRKQCRSYAEKYFDSARMADRYIYLYGKAIQKYKS